MIYKNDIRADHFQAHRPLATFDSIGSKGVCFSYFSGRPM